MRIRLYEFLRLLQVSIYSFSSSASSFNLYIASAVQLSIGLKDSSGERQKLRSFWRRLVPCQFQENEKAPAFKLPIYVKNIQKGKHGSDSGVYDANGRYLSNSNFHLSPSPGEKKKSESRNIKWQQHKVSVFRQSWSHFSLYFTEWRQGNTNKQTANNRVRVFNRHVNEVLLNRTKQLIVPLLLCEMRWIIVLLMN